MTTLWSCLLSKSTNIKFNLNLRKNKSRFLFEIKISSKKSRIIISGNTTAKLTKYRTKGRMIKGNAHPRKENKRVKRKMMSHMQSKPS
jgi:hypothetical protein